MMIFVDLETYYDRDFSLSKISTEEYIRDPRFEVIGVAVKVDDEETQSFSGSRAETKAWLQQFDWGNSLACAHNALFDAAIMAWHFEIYPKAWADTMSMAQALLGTRCKVGLAHLASYFNIGTKGTEVINALGKTRKSFTHVEMERYMSYCRNDVDLTAALYTRMYNFRANDDFTFEEFPLKELKLIDLTIRMFTQPVLEVDVPLLEAHLIKVKEDKAKLLDDAGINLEDVMSNPKFAEILCLLGVVPPTKISPTTGKVTYAFAKTDEAFRALVEHDDLRVQAVVAARLGVKTTIEESRTERFIGIGKRGPLPVPLKYYAAHTGRWGGSDKLNMQNLPSRGNASALKKSLRAPAGHVIISCDSSQIEARTLAWLAGQEDLVTAFANGEDVYKIMASKIYHKPVTEITKEERFFGKTVILGCGYGMGAEKFHGMLSLIPGAKISMGEAERIIAVYRGVNPKIVRLWKLADRAIHYMATSTGWTFGRGDLLEVGERYVILPNTMKIEYHDLRNTNIDGWIYSTLREKNVKLYGGKLVENCIAEGTDVLTDRGWVSIEKVRATDKVHDGVEFVAHGGVVFKSVQTCVIVDGVYMTPDHEVLTDGGWQAASQNPKPYRPDLRHVGGVEPRAQRWEETELEVPLPVRDAMRQGRERRKERGQTGRYSELRVQNQRAYIFGEYEARDEQAPGVCGMEVDGSSLSPTLSSSVGQLWRAGNFRLCRMAEVVRELLVRYGAYIHSWVGVGSQGQQRPLLAAELPLDFEAKQYDESAEHRATGRRTAFERTNRNIPHDPLLSTNARVAGRADNPHTKPSQPVYDILNAGPRTRFVVRGNSGPFIVHNCVQALARIIVGEQMLKIAKKYRPVLTVHDAVSIIVPEQESIEAMAYVQECMRWVPKWANGLPVDCEIGCGPTYADS